MSVVACERLGIPEFVRIARSSAVVHIPDELASDGAPALWFGGATLLVFFGVRR